MNSKTEMLKTRDYHEVIPELKETYLTAEPGKMFSYSNVGYTVLGHGGNTTCHHSVFNYIPDLDAGIVVMTNSQNSMGLSGAAGMTVLVEYLKEKGIAKTKTQRKYVECNDE